MEIKITVKGIHEHDAKEQDHAIRNYINDKDIAHIKKFLENIKPPVFLDITIHISKPHPHHSCDLRIHGPHTEIIVKKEGPEVYKVIDDVFDETKRELARRKEKIVDSRKKGNPFK